MRGVCDCGKAVDQNLKAFCSDCFEALKKKYRKEVILNYGHEVLSPGAHLAELQEAVEAFLTEANKTPSWDKDAVSIWSSMIGQLSQALLDSRKKRPSVEISAENCDHRWADAEPGVSHSTRVRCRDCGLLRG